MPSPSAAGPLRASGRLLGAGVRLRVTLLALMALSVRPALGHELGLGPDTLVTLEMGGHTGAGPSPTDSLQTQSEIELEIESDRDTLRTRFEAGAASDVTNEQFYEDAFVDTIALGRRLV